MNSGSFFLFLFIVLILAVCVGAGLRLRRRLRLLKDVLDRAENMLKLSGKDASVVFAQSSGLRQPWKRYTSTFISTPDGQPKTDRLAQDFFRVNDVLDHHINLRLYLALPNILVGIGVLGTFIGLVAGLVGLKQSLSKGTRKHISVALRDVYSLLYVYIWNVWVDSVQFL